MRGDETASSTRMMCVGSSIVRGGDDTTFSATMDSPPPDAIWTIDKVLLKPPMAPIRQRPSRGGSSISTRESQGEYLQNYYDVRNQEEPDEKQDEQSEMYGDYSNHDDSYNRMLHNFDGDDEDDDEEMIHLHRMILPSRKLFVEDELEEDPMMVELPERDEVLIPVFMNATAVAPFQDNLRSVHLPASHLPKQLLLPTLHYPSSEVGNGRDVEHILRGTNSRHNQFSVFGNNHHPLLQRFEPVLVEDDFVASAISSSTSDDELSLDDKSVGLFEPQHNFNASLSPSRGAGNQIFRRLEDGDQEQVTSSGRRHSLQFFRPLPSSLFENYPSDAIADELDAVQFHH